MTPAEKKLLEAMLERGLGVQRRKPTAKDKVESARANKSAKHLEPRSIQRCPEQSKLGARQYDPQLRRSASNLQQRRQLHPVSPQFGGAHQTREEGRCFRW
jgi:hypothetical protein